MRISNFPNCCAINIIHDFMGLEFENFKAVTEKFEKCLNKAAYPISKDGFVSPIKYTIIVLSKIQYKMLKPFLEIHSFNIIFEGLGAHDEQLYILIRVNR